MTSLASTTHRRALRDLPAHVVADAVDDRPPELEHDHAGEPAVPLPDRPGQEDPGLARGDAHGEVGDDVLARERAAHVVARLPVVEPDHVRAGGDDADPLVVGEVRQRDVRSGGQHLPQPALRAGRAGPCAARAGRRHAFTTVSVVATTTCSRCACARASSSRAAVVAATSWRFCSAVCPTASAPRRMLTVPTTTRGTRARSSSRTSILSRRGRRTPRAGGASGFGVRGTAMAPPGFAGGRSMFVPRGEYVKEQAGW